MILYSLDLPQGITDYLVISGICSVLLRVLLLTGALYLLWRAFTFIFLPILRPHEPPELPYRIPSGYL